ncbi:MAG: RNA polymerase sigma factor [Chloroflexota bacterium]
MDLIHRYQAGDESAFADLFEQYKNLVFKTAYLMLGTTEEAEDALQEVFLKVHRSLATYQSTKGAFTTWLHRLTVNHCLNQKRKRQLPLLPLQEIMGLGDVRPIWTERLADEELLQQALTHLSDKQRAVIILRYYWDLPYLEIAQILDIPLGTVRSRLNTTMKLLHQILSKMDAPTPSATAPLALNQGGSE